MINMHVLTTDIFIGIIIGILFSVVSYVFRTIKYKNQKQEWDWIEFSVFVGFGILLGIMYHTVDYFI